MTTETTFKDVPIGGEFRQSHGVESGILSHLDEPGAYRYRKVSARRMECIGYGGVLFDEPDARERLSEMLGRDANRFILMTESTRSGPVGSSAMRAWVES